MAKKIKKAKKAKTKVKPKKRAQKKFLPKHAFKNGQLIKPTQPVEAVYQPKIAIVGIGGGGGSIVSEMAKNIAKKRLPHSHNIKFIVANVDVQAIKAAPRQTKTFYFGRGLTHGLGCGMNPALGKIAALESKKEIEKLIKKCDFCLFVSSLGGGTGSGAAPIFAEIAKNLGVLCWGIYTQPFRFEGRERIKIASDALRSLKPNLNAITILPNQKIFKIVDQKTSIQKSLSAMNSILVKTLEGLIETLYCPGLINLDFADFKAVLENANSLAYLNCEEFSGQNRAEKAVQAVLNNPLIDYNIAGAENMLFNIAGSKDMRMSEVEQISKTISAFNPRAKIIFGVSQDNQYKNKIKITLIAIGCGQPEKPKPKIKRKRSKIKKRILEKKAEAKKSVDNSTTPKTIDKNKVKAVKKNDQQKFVEIKKEEPKEEELKEEKKADIIKKVPAKKIIIPKKTTIRRNAVDLHKQAEEDEKKMLEEESKWDIPSFLRKNHQL